jgi:hypothetical protein
MFHVRGRLKKSHKNFRIVFGANYKTYKLLDEDMKTLTQHLREEGIADIFFRRRT